MADSSAKILDCDESWCWQPAKFEVFWPGRNPPPHYCAEHALRAYKILEAMGFSATVRSVTAKVVSS